MLRSISQRGPACPDTKVWSNRLPEYSRREPLAPGAQAEAVSQRVLVLPARPHREADARGRQVLRVALERQAVDVDDPLVRRAADVGVRGQGEAGVQLPAPPRADGGEVAPDIVGHGPRDAAGQHLLEVPLRQPVLALEEEGPRQLQAHPHQRGIGDQHLAEGRDRLVVQNVLRGLGKAGSLRRVEGDHALAEQLGGPVGAPAGRGEEEESGDGYGAHGNPQKKATTRRRASRTQQAGGRP